jgi:hypothetical protein
MPKWVDIQLVASKVKTPIKNLFFGGKFEEMIFCTN